MRFSCSKPNFSIIENVFGFSDENVMEHELLFGSERRLRRHSFKSFETPSERQCDGSKQNMAYIFTDSWIPTSKKSWSTGGIKSIDSSETFGFALIDPFL